MNKILILIGIFTLNLNCYAQSNLAMTATKQKNLELVNHQDEMLEFLLQIPFEQRQYIFPMLSEKQSIPKKIKTHPDVLVWKGKKPTKIAKRFQNDPELLEFLPAQFYYFLAPEMWPEENKKAPEINPNQLFMNITDNNSDTTTTEELIQFKNGLEIVYKHLPENQKDLLNSSSSIYLSKLMIFPTQQMEEELKKQGYTSARDFAKTVDEVADIYRQYVTGKNPPPSENQKLVQNYLSLIPYIFKKAGFSALLDTKAYSD